MNSAILMCLKNGRFINYHDFILVMVESSIFDGSIYCNCSINLTIKIKDKNILKDLELEIKLHNLNMLAYSYPAIVLIRIYFKTINTLYYIGALNKRTLGQTDYFQTDPSRGNVFIP